MLRGGRMGWQRRAGLEVAWLVAYVAAAAASSELGSFGDVTVWYPPAGIAVAAGTLRRWAALPSLALGEVVVGALVFPGLPIAAVVVNGALYAAVYTAAGVAVREFGGMEAEAPRRRPAGVFLLAIGVAPLVAAAVGVTARVLTTGVETGVTTALWAWWVGDAIGVATLALTIVAVVVRARRGEQWWTLGGHGLPMTAVVALAPAAVTGLLLLTADEEVHFAALVFLPYLLAAVWYGLPGVAVAAPPTSLALTYVADDVLGIRFLSRVDMQLLLLALLVAGLGFALITEERAVYRRHLALRELHLRQAQLLAGSGSALWDVPSGRVAWSEGLLRLAGSDLPSRWSTRRDMAPDDYERCVHPDDRRAFDAAIGRTLDEGASCDLVHRLRRPDGTTVVVRLRTRPRLVDGAVQQVTLTCNDITREEHAAQRLGSVLVREHSARTAQRRADEAEERARDRARLADHTEHAVLAGVDHLVRPPLVAVHELTSSLLDPRVDHDPLRHHTAVLSQVRHLAEQLEDGIADLMDLHGRADPRIATPGSPTRLAGTVQAAVAATVEPGTVLVAAETRDVDVDARVLRRVVEHLLADVVPCPRDREPVTLSALVDDGAVHLVVEEHGRTIPEDELLDLFELPPTTPEGVAEGRAAVARYLVRRYAELHDGHAWADGRADRGPGTAWHVELPLRSG